MNLAHPTPLPTPPNSTQTKVEHCFDEHSHDNATSTDAPLFTPEPAARSERGTSPTDAVLFPQQKPRFATASPPTVARNLSPKRSRLEYESNSDATPRKSMRFSRSPSPERSSKRAPYENLLEPSPMAQPSQSLPPLREAMKDSEQTYHLPRPSEPDRELTASFAQQFRSGVVDFGTEKWFSVRYDVATNTWLQPQFQLSPPPRQFAPINGYALKPKSANPVVNSIEPPQKPTRSPKKQQLKPQKTPRKRSSATPTGIVPNGKGETRSTRNPANKPLSSKNFRDYPDYAPRGSNSGADAMKLAQKIPQMSGSKNLVDDPLRYELSDAERVAAERAGMDCARYLCTKRAVFVGFVKYLRYAAGKYELTPEDVKKGLKSWNKTAAQGCSGIDVNKTSALWAGFWQPMGWFDKDAFKQLQYADEVYLPKFDKDGNVVPQYDRAGNLMN